MRAVRSRIPVCRAHGAAIISCAPRTRTSPCARPRTPLAARQTTCFRSIRSDRHQAPEILADDVRRSAAFQQLARCRARRLKRLLRDQGAKIGAIDAKPDKPSEAAMAGIPQAPQHEPEREHGRSVRRPGNRGAQDDGAGRLCDLQRHGESNLGRASAELKGKWSTRGWWKIAAGGCAKAITEALATDKVYILAQTPGGRADRPTAPKNSAPPMSSSMCKAAAIAKRVDLSKSGSRTRSSKDSPATPPMSASTGLSPRPRTTPARRNSSNASAFPPRPAERTFRCGAEAIPRSGAS